MLARMIGVAILKGVAVAALFSLFLAALCVALS